MAKRRITQHKRFALRAHPNPDFVGTSFMLEPLGEIVDEKHIMSKNIAQYGG